MDNFKRFQLKSVFIKALSLLVSVVIVFSASAVGIISAAGENNAATYWDGTVATSFAGGTGTETDPFLIENAAQLRYMLDENCVASSVTTDKFKYYKLTKDIYINNVQTADLKSAKSNDLNAQGFKGWQTGLQNKGFYGQFDGDGHTVYGLYYEATANNSTAGLIPTVIGGTVKNVILKNSAIGGKYAAGGIVGLKYGSLYSITVENCMVDNVDIACTGSVRIGGIMGGGHNSYVGTITINNCSLTNAALIGGSSGYPGIEAGILGYIGKTGNHTVSKCFVDDSAHPLTNATNSSHFESNMGGYVTYTDVYYIRRAADESRTFLATSNVEKQFTVLTADQMKGTAAKTNMPGLDFDTVWQTVEGNFPVLRIGTTPAWDGTKDYNLEGEGSEASPYLIKTPAQLAAIVTGNNGGAFTGKYFKLANDIKINDTSKANWKDTARNWVWADFRFVGTFDGDGHTIDGLYYKGSQRVMGLFSYVGADNNGVYKTTLKNFKMTNAYIESTGADGAGFAAGQASRVAYFEGIYIDDTCEINATTRGVGGVLGQSGYNVFMSNIAMNGKVVGGSNVGAFTGTVSSGARLDIKSSYTTADLYAQGVTDRNLATASSAVYVVKKQGTVDAIVTQLTADQMKGDAAKTNMADLDFDTIFQTVENDYPIINIREAVELPPEPLWDGTKDSNLEGEGSEASPYLIKTPEQLAYVVSTDLPDGKYYKLANDIKIHDTTKANWKKSARNWVWGNIRFVGNFDGDGHTVDGIYFNGNQSKFGMFSYVGDSVITNLKITNAYIVNTTANGVAVLAGQTSASTTFEHIYIDDTCLVTAINATGVSGITSYGYDKSLTATIKNSAVLATLVGKTQVGAFAGAYWGSDQVVIQGCFSAVDGAKLSGYQGLTNSFNNYGLVTDTYGTTILTKDQMKGDAAKTNMVDLDFDTIFKVVENDFPIIEVREAAVVPPPPPAPTLPDYVWDGTAADSFAGGTGTEEDPFIIETPEQLYKMVAEYSTYEASNGKFFKITEDLYLNDVKDGTPLADLAYKNNWLKNYGSEVPTASKANAFNGTLNGDNHTIYGLYVEDAASGGLFPAISSYTVVKNLAFNNVLITGSGAGGALAGQAIYRAWQSAAAINGCSVVNATIGLNADKEFAGGLIGNINDCSVIFTNCYAYDLSLSNWDSKGTPGGLVGSAWNSGTLKIETSYCAGYFPVNSNVNKAQCSKVYTNVAIPDGNTTAGVTVLADAHMKGDFAKTYMSGLDFERTFKITTNSYPVHFVYVRPANVWDGKIADSFAGGSGTAEDPYLIENGGQLYKMVAEFSNKTVSEKPTTRTYFKITKDIDLGYNQWYTISVGSWLDNAAYTTIGFNGVINGDGHTIKGLYNGKAAGAVGLIPVAAQGAEIHNLHLDGGRLPKIAYNNYATGAFIGFSRGASNATPIVIKGCSVKNFEIEAVNGAAAYIGYAYSSSAGIYNSYVSDTTISVTAETSSNAAAFIGYTGGNDWLNTIKIANSYAAKVNPVPYLNANFKKITTFTNVYTDYDSYDNSVAGLTKLTTDKMQGEAAKTYMQGFEFGFAWQTVENGYPVHMLYVKPDYVWDGGTATSFAGGTGTSEDPFIIKTGAQLYKMVSEYSNAETASGTVNKQYYFRLANDIYLNDVKAADMLNTTEAHWTSKFNTWYSQTSYSKGFCGNLDGAGFTVYGLYTNKGYAGLIPVLVDGGNIHNLNLKNSFVYGTESAGGLVGFVKSHYTLSPVFISYCSVDNVAVESPKTYVGGLVGGCADIKTTVTDCSVTRVNLTSTNENANYVSAFVGNGWGNIQNEITNSFTDSTAHPVSFTTDAESYGKLAARYLFTNVYTSAKKNIDVKGVTYVTEDSLKGAKASATLKGFNFTADWQTVDGDFPQIRKGAGSWRYDTGLPGEVWSGKLAAAYASGDGSKEAPFEIKTAGQLALLANDALNGKTFGRYYIITADIVLNNTAKENWTANANEWFVGSWDQAFRGHLNGNYHIISGLYLNKTSENYSGSKYYGGLFAAISKNAVIEKLGIVDSSLTFTHATATKYLGAFAGFVAQYNGAETPYEEYPLIRECFADTTVTLNGGSCGGFIGCATRPIRIEDSFFTGKVGSATRGLFGYSKMNNDYGVVLVKNFYAADSKYAVLSNTSYDNFRYENCYSSSAQDSQGVTRLFIDRMCGKNAAEYMLGFDFNKVWAIRADNETPGLKGFNQKAFSNEMNPEDITISFETNCDLVVEPMVGKAYSKLTLPVLEREGYTFEGWYSYAELDTPYTFDYFPTFNIILYAKWSLNGLSQDFENYEDSVYDYHEGIEYYRPTTEGYTAKYVRSGAKSMHRIAGGSDYRDFLLFYNQELEIGKTYKMVYYTTTDMENAAIDVSLVHLDWPDVYTAAKGIVPMGTIENLTDGKWVENTFTFVAKSKWIAIRTEGDASIYFDDFTLYSTSDKADDALSGAAAGFFGSTCGVIATVAAAAVVLGGAGAAIFFVARRKKQ